MTGTDKLSLTWGSFPVHQSDIFQELFSTGDQADLTLVCEDLKQLRTHKFLLVCSSPVFRSILSNITNTQAVLYLRGVHSEEMESVLEYLYLGQTQISQQKVDQFFKVASDLKIKDISKSERTMEKVVVEEEKEAENLRVKTKAKANQQIEVENQVKFENYEIHACNYCKRKFTLENSLRKHIETVHSKSEYYSCSQCESSFRDETSLSRHVQSVHAGAKLTCRHCQEKYSSKAGLQFHMKRVHNNAQ